MPLNLNFRITRCMEECVPEKGIDSIMIQDALRKLLFDQLIRDQIQLREGHPFFFAMFKYHKSCLWSGAEFVEWRGAGGERIVQQSRECEVMSHKIRRLVDKSLEEGEKKENLGFRMGM